MDSFKLSDILAFLELRFGQALVLSLSCFAAYFSSMYDIVNFGDWTDTINAGLFVLGIFAAITVMWKILHQVFVTSRKWFKSRKAVEQIRQRMNSLSAEEEEVVLYCLENNMQTFTAQMTQPAAASLMAKRFVFIGVNQVSILDTPFTFYDHVWELLKKEYQNSDA